MNKELKITQTKTALQSCNTQLDVQPEELTLDNLVLLHAGNCCLFRTMSGLKSRQKNF
uniref:Uncharacterized protein n=1 Tax=Rhizophora mucronata TaxID=61149 RepID=A0A2P2N4Y4_RHIMU